MPVCPKCGSARVERFCAKCGAPAAIAPVWGGRMQPRQQAPVPLPPRPRAGGSGGGKFFVCFGLIFGLMFLFSAVRTSLVLPTKSPVISAPAVRDGSGRGSPTGMRFVELRDQIDSKLLDGTRRVLELQNRAAAIRNVEQQWDEQRSAVENLRQRLGQARVVAEDEGRWPVRAAGRTFGRADMDSAIDRTERYLQRNRRITGALSSLATVTIMAFRDANTQLDAMRRLQNELRLGIDPRREREMGREFGRAAERFDAIVNDPQLSLSMPEIPRFDLDSPQY